MVGGEWLYQMINISEKRITYPFFHFTLNEWHWKKMVILKNLPKEGFTDYHDLEKSDTNSIPEYANVVQQCVEEEMEHVSNSIGYPSVLLGMWYERSFRNERHGVHNHGACGYSAVLYVKFNPEVHESTRFYLPFPDPMSGSIHNFHPPVKEGDLIIFPSHMLHEAVPNKSDEERLIVSFNIMGRQMIYSNKDRIWGNDIEGWQRQRELDRKYFDGPEY
jgi:hypothetical protein